MTTRKRVKKTTATKALLVTTDHRGVFFGYGVPTAKSEIKLTDAQMCIYWSSDLKGVLGLASMGPSRNCKVGIPVPSIILRGVTAVTEVTKEAEAAWKKAPWN